jgi:hypothetical protein
VTAGLCDVPHSLTWGEMQSFQVDFATQRARVVGASGGPERAALRGLWGLSIDLAVR